MGREGGGGDRERERPIKDGHCYLDNSVPLSFSPSLPLSFPPSLPRSLSEQSSADNAERVGLMAEDFAKKGWHFAQRQQARGLSHSPSPSPRHYSTLSATGEALGRLQVNQMKMAHANGYSCGASEGSLMALMTGDTASFPPRLREMRESLAKFTRDHILSNERAVLDHQLSGDRWTPLPLMEQLKVTSCSDSKKMSKSPKFCVSGLEILTAIL